MHQLSAAVHTALLDAGYHPGQVIGAGMEGVVVELGDGLGADLVAKTWHTRGADDLERLQLFYGAVATSRMPLASPSVVRILKVGAQFATIERRLHGRALRTAVGDTSAVISDAEVSCVVRVLSALRAAVPTDAMSVLPVLEGEPAFDASTEFTASLTALIERRVHDSHDVLAGRVRDLDRVVSAVTSRLSELSPTRQSLVHGDLIPANILVDDAGVPTAVLDFGFLSTLGDPRFDAAVAASIFDMYGPHGRTSQSMLDDAICGEFEFDIRTLDIYRAAYSLVTSNCFSVSGSDGHFAWCAAMLNRPEVRAAIDA